MEKSNVIREIDLTAAAKTVLKERKPLTVSVVAGVVMGLVIALSSPKVYTADVVLAPEIASGGLGLSGNLADMASSFGIDLGSAGKSMDALYPEIYPEILASNDFIHTLFTVPVRLKNDDTVRTYYDHLVKDTKIPFWQYPKAWLAELTKPKDPVGKKGGASDPFKISRIDDEMCKAIGGSIGCVVDKKTSVITISVTDQDPLVAAIIADTLQQRLQNYITQYRTKKARTDFSYYTKLHTEAKEKYQKAQSTYAAFCDANQEVMLETYIARRDELENEMQTAFTLMNQMAVQMQTAKAKIQERTPAYTVIKSAKMPYRASGMSRLMMLIMTVFVAVMADAAWVLFVRDLVKKKNA
ncbi:MAG: chain-length determining protein [Prevotella sp.]|nr:chain-length determining protein [Prevotella sp.]